MRAGGALALLAAAAALGTSCRAGPDQWVVQVTTNAPVPSWGDRVLLEVLDDEGKLACDDCRRELAVDPQTFPISFGVTPPASGGGRHVRARFYRSSQAGPDGLPEGTALIDMLGRLPARDASNSTYTLLMLEAFCFGKPADLAGRTSCSPGDSSTPAGTVTPEADLPGATSPWDQDLLAASHLLPGGIDQFGAPCPAAAVAGMVCIPPRAFLMGSARSIGVSSDFPSLPEIVVQPLFAMYLDVDEVTVGAVRQVIRSGALTAPSILRRGDPGVSPACTYLGPDDPSNDDLPLNCVSHQDADHACTALGKELITEIDFEMTASNGGEKTFYPWGEDAPTCDRAVLSVDGSCVRTGPVAGGSPNDVNARGVRNLGGNLSEWVADILVPYTDDCWNQINLDTSGCSEDPRSASWSGPWPHRGGSWSGHASSAATFARFASADGSPSPDIGFRCKQTVLVTP